MSSYRPRRIGIIGFGLTQHAKARPDLTIEGMCVEAYKMALEDVKRTTGMHFDSNYIDSTVIAVFSDHFSGQLLQEAIIHDHLGLNPKRSLRAMGGGATGGIGIQTGYALVAAGMADTVAVVGFEKMSEVSTPKGNEFIALASDTDFDFKQAGFYSGYYAAMATKLMEKFGTTEEQMALSAVKNRQNAQLNPFAQTSRLNPYRTGSTSGPVTVADVMYSGYIATPLKRLDCCLMSDGAAVVIMASEEKIREWKLEDYAVWFKGVGMGTDMMRPGDRPRTPGGLLERDSKLGEDLVLPHERDNKEVMRLYNDLEYPGIWAFRAGRRATKEAYMMAGIQHPLEEIDIAEIHDAFTSSELQTCEDIGLCPYGSSGKFIEGGHTQMNGRLPVNPSGGLIGMGHSVGSSGVWQVGFVFKQLQGTIDDFYRRGKELGSGVPAESAQIEGALTGVAHSHAGTGSHVTVSVLSKNYPE